MKINKNYVITILIFLCVCFNTQAQEVSDSLLTKDYVYKLASSNPQEAQRIINIIREKKKTPKFVIDIMEGDFYFRNAKYRQALSFYKKALDNDPVQANEYYYMELLHRMIACYNFLNNTTKKTEYVKILMAKADSCKNDAMLSIAHFNMGNILYYRGDKDRAYQYINSAIDLIKKADYHTKYDHLCHIYNTLLMFQKKDNLYDEALITLDSLQVAITKTNEASYIIKYTDIEKKSLYAHKAVILSCLKKDEEAKEYYDKWLALNNTYDQAETVIMPYLFNNKMYDDIIEINLKKEKFIYQYQDSISHAMLEIKKQLAEAYRLKKDYQKAVNYFGQLTAIADSIKIREQKALILEYAAIYETRQKDAQIQEQKALAQKRKIYLTSASIIVIILTVVLFILYYIILEIKKRNRIMAKNIKELQYFRKEHLFSIKKNDKISLDDIPDKSLSKLYTKLSHLVNEEKIYLNTNLTRDDVVTKLNTNKNIFVDMLKKNTGLTFSEYINELRLNDSLLLLENTDQDQSIESIAEQVGFSKSSFYRLFKEKFGMTPAEYKHQFRN